MLALKQYRSRKRGFSDLLNSAAVIGNGIILNKDGSLMAAWQYDGPDTESATAGERNHLSAQLNAILARLGTGTCSMSMRSACPRSAIRTRPGPPSRTRSHGSSTRNVGAIFSRPGASSRAGTSSS